MALPDAIKLTAPTSRSSGITSESVSAGANFLGASIDNRTNLDTFADIEVLFSCASAPTAGTVLEIYLLYSVDNGTNYETGDASTDPGQGLVGVAVARADTDPHRQTIRGVALQPHPFKVLVKSELDQSATVTVAVYTYNDTVVE